MTFAKRFLCDRRGATAIVFATALVPLIAGGGFAIDYIRASSVRAQLQATTDAAAMAGAVSRDQTDAGRTQAAENSFDANVIDIKHGATAGRTATPATGTITVTATASVPTTFMRLFNMNAITVNATSTVASGGKKLELAIVLDTTGSMNFDGKLDNLKSALPTILDIVMPPGNTDTRVALVPFATYVNVGATNTALLTGRVSPYTTNQCVLERKNGARPNEDPPTSGSDEFDSDQQQRLRNDPADHATDEQSCRSRHRPAGFDSRRRNLRPYWHPVGLAHNLTALGKPLARGLGPRRLYRERNAKGHRHSDRRQLHRVPHEGEPIRGGL